MTTSRHLSLSSSPNNPCLPTRPSVGHFPFCSTPYFFPPTLPSSPLHPAIQMPSLCITCAWQTLSADCCIPPAQHCMLVASSHVTRSLHSIIIPIWNNDGSHYLVVYSLIQVACFPFFWFNAQVKIKWENKKAINLILFLCSQWQMSVLHLINHQKMCDDSTWSNLMDISI